MATAVRIPLVIAAVAFAIGVPALQALLDLGLSASEFSRSGDSTLRASGYAFSIWSIIYAGLAAYAVWQALPRNRGDAGLAAIALPSTVAISGCGFWIIAASQDLRWLSVAVIAISALTLTAGLLRARSSVLRAGWKDRLFAWWPLSLLAGWLTVASALNVLTVMTAEGLLSGAPKAAAFLGIVVVLIVGLAVVRSGRLWVYGLPIAWGLAAVWAAERGSKGDVAALAIGAAILLGAYAAWQARTETRQPA